MTQILRTHRCAEVTEALLGKQVTVAGWVHRRRDHGGVIFIDLRDSTGLLQIVFQPELKESFEIADSLRSEYIIKVVGHIRKRPQGMSNPELVTGTIEIFARHVEILSVAKTPPFPLNSYATVSEEVRLRYRYVDLRRPEMLARFRFRAKLIATMRDYLTQARFMEVETPTLTRATPEGARDYLVPSRTHPGEFFALPQSPQLFKQLLMMSGFDRYYQLVRCFRDEDLRSDRQPEFTQLDIETSFMNELEIQDCMEGLIQKTFKTLLDVDLGPFPRMTHAEVVARYGSDKPDLRNPLFLVDIDPLVKNIDFQVFSKPAQDAGSRVVAMRVPGASDHLSRKQLDDYASFVCHYGAKGLAYIKVNDRDTGVEGLQSPILKFFPADVVLQILDTVDAQTGDIIFFSADETRVVNESMAAFRVKVSEDCGLLSTGWKPLWVIDFPMFEPHGQHLQATHHPFTAPKADLETLQRSPKNCLSRAYDLVLNGYEIGGGSIRIHEFKMQMAVFALLGLSEKEAHHQFSFLLEALQYGCPPLGGIAFGIDRIAMLMTGTHSLREVIAFPKTQSATCPLTEAPTAVDRAQLRELGIIKTREKT